MMINPNLSNIASIISDPSRAAILTVLMDNRFHSAGELAYMARIKPQTTSYHLAKLIDADLIMVENQGRHRYFKIQNQEVAQIMETLLTLSSPPKIRSLKQSTEDKQVRFARTCYDHPAGYLGVQLTEALIKKEYLTDEFILTDSGAAFLSSLGIDIQEVRKKRRSFCHKCLDWSEKRYHVAGALGYAILELLLNNHWVERLPKTRALKITNGGKKALKEIFSINLVNN
ncbi:helix-turn-helix domain-containing protein [Bacillus xiapuensis]|uniref:Helix-turn-helix domain-containing protein n=1 Tax=Bacillus xiapuensis TaxID=2014075 RepID=A0ABU6N9G8_9BACI|nr:helix-turn-helix domain-containing protein [Bacillus xiapuensis]